MDAALRGDIWVKTARRRRTRRALATILVVVAFLGSALYWLQTAGSAGPSISPPAGTVNGEIAAVTPLTSSITRSVGAAQLQTGVSLSRLAVAKDSTDKIRVSIIWINPSEAHQVLNNPNAQIALGIYRPVHTGGCSSPNPDPSNSVAVTDTNSVVYCAHLDNEAGVKPPFDDGRLLLARNLHTGYLRPLENGSGSVPACTAITTSWCQPATMTADQRALYVAAQILTPGGNPQGQQNNLETLEFFVSVKRSG